MSQPAPSSLPAAEAEDLIAALDSLIGGEAAAERLIAMGPQVIPLLERVLLDGPSRTIAVPRSRAVRILGELGAWPVLVTYFRQYRRPEDAAVLFAEDGVRSAAAEQLAQWKSDEVYEVLLEAARQRVTGGLIRALSEFGRAEAIPILFLALDDDLCREDAGAALRKMPAASRDYAVLSLRGAAGAPMSFPASLCRRRAVLQLLRDLGAGREDWPILREYLEDTDADSVIATAAIGFAIAQTADDSAIVSALFRISRHLNWAQEDEVILLLEEHRDIACEAARAVAREAEANGEHPDWLVPQWRILRRLTGAEIQNPALDRSPT